MDGGPENLLILKPLHVYFGPNQFASEPVLVCELALAAIEAVVLRDGLAAVLAQYADHQLGIDVGDAQQDPPLAVARLLAGLAMSMLNRTRGFITACGARSGDSGRAVLWTGFHALDTTRAALAVAARTVSSALRAPLAFRAETLAPHYSALQDRCRVTHPDYQARILMVAARARNLPVVPLLPSSRIWQYGWGARGRVFFESATNDDGMIGANIASSKHLSKVAFRQLGIPVPSEVIAVGLYDLPGAIEAVGWPCVVKPIDCGGGKGITVGVGTPGDLEAAFLYARRFTDKPILIESFVAGIDHRLAVIDGVLVATVRRDPPAVQGDGRSDISQLLAGLNASRSPNPVKPYDLQPIVADEVVISHLRRQGLSLDVVLEVGRRVSLRGNANVSTGGTCTKVAVPVNPEVRLIAETLATTLGLASAGIDYITSDIGKSPSETGGRFIEVNTAQGLDAGVYGGMTEEEIGSLALGPRLGRIPLVLVLTPEPPGPAFVRALRSEAAVTSGLAWLCGSEAGLPNMNLVVSHLAPPERPSVLLRQRATESAIICFTVRDLCRFGSPVDQAGLGILDGADLPQAWRRVVERVCGRVIKVDGADEVLAACRAFFAYPPI